MNTVYARTLDRNVFIPKGEQFSNATRECIRKGCARTVSRKADMDRQPNTFIFFAAFISTPFISTCLVLFTRNERMDHFLRRQ